MTNEIQTTSPNLVGDRRIIDLVKDLEQSKASIILDKFGDAFKLASEWDASAKAIKVDNEFQLAEMKRARELRLKLRAKRIDIENVRKDLKEDSLKEGRAVDAVSAALKGLIEPVETYLEGQEKFAETLAASRRAALSQERHAKWLAVASTPSALELADLSEDQFQILIAAETEKQKRMAEEKEKEAARIKAEAEEREKLRLENEKLRSEREAAEKKAAADKRAADAAVAAEKKKADDAAKAATEAARAKEKELAAAQKKIEAAKVTVAAAKLSAFDEGWNAALKEVYTYCSLTNEGKEYIRSIKK